jgi:N,N'-diacetyllegionaminate synthase
VIENAVNTIQIAGRKIGFGEPTFVIAEAGVNHNGKLLLAKRLVDIACDAGADAVKFQTFRAERLTGPSAEKAAYQKRTTPADESQLVMLKQLELSEADFRELWDHCRTRNIIFLSTPFDEESVDFLDVLGVPAFKVPSGEITNWPLLERVAAKKKSVILSTGMANLGEIEAAVRRVRDFGAHEIALLQCVSEYPARIASVNLRVILTLAKCFGTPVGLSDHTLGTEIAVAAVALGANILEKHFTSDKSLPGPDHSSSLEPEELKTLVAAIRNVEAALGDGIKGPTTEELRNSSVVRRSLMAAAQLEAGSRLVPSMVVFKRPGTGLSLDALSHLLGRRLRRTVAAGELLEFGMFE